MITDEELDEWKKVATRQASHIADAIEIDPLGHDWKDKRIVELIRALRKDREKFNEHVVDRADQYNRMDEIITKLREDKKALVEALENIIDLLERDSSNGLNVINYASSALEKVK